MVFALIGNQNCGKTTLFNQLTGSNQHVGNFPGVTVDKKEGTLKKHKDVTVVDLPGIYSLSPYTAEEIVTRDFLLKEKPDAVINILDATNIERNLYLTLQLVELGIPMILALNLMDEVRNNGDHINIVEMEELLGIHAVPISAAKNEGIDELVEQAVETANKKIKPKRLDFCKGEVHKAIHSIAHIVEDKALKADYPIRFCATKMVEGDEVIAKELNLSETELDIIHHIVEEMEHNLQSDKDAILADMRYDYIEALCRLCVSKHAETKEHLRSVKIDTLLTHKYFGIPIFLGIMMLVFWLTFGVIGVTISDLFATGIDFVIAKTNELLINIQLSEVLRSLIIDGVFQGVGSVLSFMPTIVILFFFLSLLEDSGYMARVAFVMDKLLRKIGLSGRSFVPMLIGFGCSVPAVMATRTLPSHRDRKMTILLIPFMSCSAKLP
ncbi:MAG: ferrous iron transport protein B, partial [Clostridia bacterium]|nr:ferrous iron transport protein B [Clostridia bacterium]